jgi:protein-S-isoprenylcysteine O-methyltransferase Ste14
VTELPSVARTLNSATLIFWFLAEVRQRRRGRRDATERDAGSCPVIWITVALGIVVSNVTSGVPWGRMPWPRLDLFAVGIALMWIGIGLRLWAFRTLGRFFTFTVMTSDDQPVVSDGPYGFVRHPSYTGALHACAGVGLVQGNWISLAAMVVIPGIGIINRIRVEERALLGTLGEPYREYAAGRKRLMPFVW